MKALSTLKSAINQSSLFAVTALIFTAPLVFPQIVMAAGTGLQTSGQPALVFQINDPAAIQTQIQSSLSYEQTVKQDPEFQALETYLNNHNSPLANYTVDLLQHDNWKTVVAISFVESNMCVHHYYYNCSGIGGQAYLRKYSGFDGWIDDMSSLLDKRYQGWSFDKMNGVYVQPKSPNWAMGAKKIYAELTTLEQQAASQRQQTILAAKSVAPVTTFPELAELTTK